MVVHFWNSGKRFLMLVRLMSLLILYVCSSIGNIEQVSLPYCNLNMLA